MQESNIEDYTEGNTGRDIQEDNFVEALKVAELIGPSFELSVQQYNSQCYTKGHSLRGSHFHMMVVEQVSGVQ